MTRLQWTVYAQGGLIALLIALAGRAAWAEGNLTVLPDPGSTRSFAASEQYETPGGFMPPGNASTVNGIVMPHNQSGTLTLNRVSSDSVHLAASDGLDTFDQTLHVNGQGIVDQPKPSYAFAELLNSLAAAMAAAPTDLRKDASWSVSISNPAWMTSLKGNASKQLSEVGMTMKVVALEGKTMVIHGDGKTDLSSGPAKSIIATIIDCAFVSGHMQKCSRKTSMEAGYGAMDMTIGNTVELAGK